MTPEPPIDACGEQPSQPAWDLCFIKQPIFPLSLLFFFDFLLFRYGICRGLVYNSPDLTRFSAPPRSVVFFSLEAGDLSFVVLNPYINVVIAIPSGKACGRLACCPLLSFFCMAYRFLVSRQAQKSNRLYHISSTYLNLSPFLLFCHYLWICLIPFTTT